MTNSLRVILWGDEVGRLAWDRQRNLAYFQYNQGFIKRGLNLSPIVAPTDGVRAMMPIWGDTGRLYQCLPPFIADSLPDSWGNQLFERWRIDNKLSLSDITPLEKLSFIGKRGMGALEFEPEVSDLVRTDKVDIKSLVDLAQRILNEREQIKIEQGESVTMQSLIAVGTSAGGRQPKAVIAVNRQTSEVRSGQIAGLEGFDYCILKFGDAARSTAELEMTYYQIATACGIDMMQSELFEVDGIRHFMTKRFDRIGCRKLHTQTLAALCPEADSYEYLVKVCNTLQLSETEIENIYRRMVFNVLANNTDDHNKNFSFIMNENGEWHLAPAYDMTCIFDSGGFLPNQNHCLSIHGKIADISYDDVIAFAEAIGIRRPEQIVKQIADALRTFRHLAQANGVANEWLGRVEAIIDKHLNDWHLSDNIVGFSFIDSRGREISQAHVEQAYKGNLHLLAVVDGVPRKYIMRTKSECYDDITTKGLSNLSESDLRRLVDLYL